MADQKVTLTLSDSAVKFLKEEAERTEKPMAEVVRQAIRRAQRIRTVRDAGGVLVVQPASGQDVSGPAKVFEIED